MLPHLIFSVIHYHNVVPIEGQPGAQVEVPEFTVQ